MATAARAGHVHLSEVGSPDRKAMKKCSAHVTHDVVAALGEGDRAEDVMSLCIGGCFVAGHVHPLAQSLEITTLDAVAHVGRRPTGLKQF
jgi:hypothetical protein